MLGLAQAAEGDFGAAEASLAKARGLVAEAQDAEMAGQIDGYLDAVRAGKPFIAP